MELWDAYNHDGSPAGCDLIRGESIPDGLCHIVCEILVKHTDGSFLLMQRDFNKEGYPGMFEASAGGSVLKGETVLDGAFRELQEETGIIADNLTPTYCVFNGRHVIYHGFLCVTDCDKSSVTLQEGETISYKWLDKEDFMEFINTEKYIGNQKGRIMIYLDSEKD